MELINSNKGGLKACLNGYMYVIKYKGKEKISWRCVKSNSLKCPAICQTKLDYSNPCIAKQHLMVCKSNQNDVGVTKCLDNMLKTIKTNEIKPAEVFAREVANLPREVQARIPPEEIVKRRLRRQKSKNNPVSPISLADLVFDVDSEWCTLGDTNLTRFLLYDNGVMAEERIVIFATDNGLRYLTKSPTWYMDGNFSLAPNIFQQLYVIRVEINNVFITAIYILLEKKTQTTYEKMLSIIMEKCEELEMYPDPNTINCDFEKAVINAIKITF